MRLLKHNVGMISLIVFLFGLVWLNLSFGWVVQSIGTWKFVPAYLLIIISLILTFLVNPELFDIKSHISAFLLKLLGLYTLFSILPGSIAGGNYDFFHGVSFRISMLMIAYTTVRIASTKRNKQIILGFYTVIFGILVIHSLIEKSGFIVITDRLDGTVSSTFHNPNLFAGVLILYLPLLLPFLFYFTQRKVRILLILLCAAGIIALAFTGCRSAFIGLVCSAAAAGLMWAYAVDNGKRRYIIPAFLVVALLLTAIVLLLPSTQEKIRRTIALGEPRLLSYKAALSMWLQTPWTFLFGNGIGSFRRLLPQYSFAWVSNNQNISSWHAVHNEFLEILVESGIIGLTVFILFLFYLTKMYFAQFRDRENDLFYRCFSAGIILTLAAWLTDSLFSTNFRELPSSGLFYIVVFSGIIPGREAVNIKSKWVRILSIAAISLLLFFSLSRNLIRLYSDRIIFVSQRAEDRDRAVNILELAVSVEPDYIVPSMLLSREYLGNGKTDLFFNAADHVEEIIPSFLDIHYLRAQAFTVLEDHYSAIREYEKHIQNGFYDLNAETALLFSYLWVGEEYNALKVFKRIVKKDHALAFRDTYSYKFTDINKIHISGENDPMIIFGADYVLNELRLIVSEDDNKNIQIINFHKVMADVYKKAGLKSPANIHERQLKKMMGNMS